MYYRVIFCDYSMESDNVGVIELAHDGCLLQEPDSVQLCCSQLELFDGHHHWPRGRLPHPLVDSSKLTRAKMLRQPVNEREYIELAPPLHHTQLWSESKHTEARQKEVFFTQQPTAAKHLKSLTAKKRHIPSITSYLMLSLRISGNFLCDS